MKSVLKSSVFAAVALIAGTFGVTQAHASNGSVGAFVGPSFVNNTITSTGVSSGTEILFGVDGTYKVMPMLNVGARVGYESLGSATVFSTTVSASVWTLLAQANYVFDGMVDGLSAGALVGFGMSSASIPGSTTSNSNTNFAFGPQAGYDYGLGGGLSVGGNVNYLIITGSNGASSTNALNVLAMVKYWF
jgi:hypothetical protein